LTLTDDGSGVGTEALELLLEDGARLLPMLT